MLVTITYDGENTTDLGYLLFKNPARAQTVELSFGRAHVFYPEDSPLRTTAALLMEIDPVSLVRGKRSMGVFDYVNDRPYVCSSFMSTAISKVFGTAMTGRGDDHQNLADSQLHLTATVSMLPCRDHEKLEAVFGPLGYEVAYDTFPLDEQFPAWGDSELVRLTISSQVRLRDLLKHLYVLIPIFDKQKHYWITEDEVDKLLRLGGDWLPTHPQKEYITSRYLKRQRRLVDLAFERLSQPMGTVLAGDEFGGKVPLNRQRLEAVLAQVKSSGAASVIDLGCGEGNLLTMLVKDPAFTRIAGVDVSTQALKRCADRLNLDEASDSKSERIRIFQGSLTYRDDRFVGYDAACVVEVIEHIDLGRLEAFERVLFQYARPRTIVLTTPNSEYNAVFELDWHRHTDHRFEWTRAQFQQWATAVAERFNYTVSFIGVGDEDPLHGPVTQMAVFTCV